MTLANKNIQCLFMYIVSHERPIDRGNLFQQDIVFAANRLTVGAT